MCDLELEDGPSPLAFFFLVSIPTTTLFTIRPSLTPVQLPKQSNLF